MNRNHRMSKKDKLNWLADIAHGLRPLDTRARKLVLPLLDDPEVDELIEWAYAQNDPRYGASAIFAMGRSGNLRWTDQVMMEMHSANREVQYEAVRAAGELGLQEATEDLIRLVRGRGVEKALRLRAIYPLGAAGDDRPSPVLEEFCHAPDREVREAARQ